MTSHSLRSLALGAGLAIVLAACGGGTATQTPAATIGVPSQSPASQAPATQAPAESGALPSFDLSSFHADEDLESLMPTSIGGEPIVALSMSGDAFMGQGSSPEFEDALGALGKSPSDLSVAFGGNSKVSIIAFQVDGAPADQILSALFTAYQQELDATISDVNIGGKAAKKITPALASEGITYIYAVRDVVFVVGGVGVPLTDALLAEVFQELP